MSGPSSVSVIVCAYNGARYLAETLSSVLAQTLGAREIIVVDDGSTDASVAVVEGHTDPRIRLIRQENQGAAAALATGIAASQGNLVAFLDQDDLWHPEMLASLVGCLESRPEIDLAFCWFQYVDSNGFQIGLASNRYRGTIDFRGLLADFVIGATSNVLVRRQAVDSAGGVDAKVPRLYDFDLFLRVAALATGNVAAVPRDLMFYRRHDSQISRNYVALEAEWEMVIDKLRRIAPSDVARAEPVARSSMRRYYARLAYETEAYPTALAYVWKGFKVAPLAFVTDSRNWLTAAACLSGAIFPRKVQRDLERVAGLRR